ncbi:cyclase [candidate division BRC1 bacterium HGW-BRC1-1]|jgi:hypothetical protein|nr:MAG: cyclase [candidate division BRC1 bacterium HGW-BRC1-1]
MKLPPLQFVAETFIPASPEEVYAFHTRPDALQLLIPPFEKTRVIRPPTSLEPGTVVELRTRIFPGIWMTILARHISHERNRYFEDEMLRGPFKLWRHRHKFLARNGGTMLRDEVEYHPPGGIIGRILDPWLVRPRLKRMFAYRHKVTLREVTANSKHS